MHIFTFAVGLFLIVTVLVDAFETIVLPRRVTRRYRLARLFYRTTWIPWRWISRKFDIKTRERVLSYYGPMSLLFLLTIWAIAMIMGFGLMHVGARSELHGQGPVCFWTYFYFSGTNLFTLGLGDYIPRNGFARFLTVMEGGMGFGFLALVIGYIPVLYQSFSRREAQISLMDARAGSPPCAMEFLKRNLREGGELMRLQLMDWERWSVELMESHLSYPVLSYFRSQHDNENWLSSIVVVLDTCAILIASTGKGPLRRQAELTFASARHAIVDLAQVFWQPPTPSSHERLHETDMDEFRKAIAKQGFGMVSPEVSKQRLEDLRRMYEPYANGMGNQLFMLFPDFSRKDRPDNWQTSAWGRITSGGSTDEIRYDDHL